MLIIFFGKGKQLVTANDLVELVPQAVVVVTLIELLTNVPWNCICTAFVPCPETMETVVGVVLVQV